MISLSMIVRNDEDMLSRTLRVHAKCFREKFAILFPSQDRTIDVLKDYGFLVKEMEWPESYAVARNNLMQFVQSNSKFKWTMMLDADESFLTIQYPVLLSEAARSKTGIIMFPRINLTLMHDPSLTITNACLNDLFHWTDFSYPDWQCRMFRLPSTASFRNNVHEVATTQTRESVVTTGEAEPSTLNFYHYGSCKPANDVWFKHHNYSLISKGQKPLSKMPDNVSSQIVPEKTSVPFKLQHPLK